MDDEAPGVPEWVVTYGDMMSLLLTFFIMLVSLSEIVAASKFQSIMQSFQKYIGYRNVPKAPLGESFPLNSLIQRMDTLGSFTKNRNAHGGVRQLAPPGVDLQVFSISRGQSTQVGANIVFGPGESELNVAGRKQLRKAAELLAGKPNKIVIVAHVAPGPLPANAATRDKTLLSYLRAREVVLALTRRKVERDRIRIVAAADTRPPKEGGDTRVNHGDRVEIFAIDKFTEHFRGPRDSDSE